MCLAADPDNDTHFRRLLGVEGGGNLDSIVLMLRPVVAETRRRNKAHKEMSKRNGQLRTELKQVKVSPCLVLPAGVGPLRCHA